METKLLLKNIYGVIAGFVLWSALWIAGDFVLLLISPQWYGEGAKTFSTAILLITLARSIIISIFCGYIAALIARKNGAATALILGILLFAFGVFIEVQLWNLIPLWYHLTFLAFLIPATVCGGRLGNRG